MPCFGGVARTHSSSSWMTAGGGSSRRPWRAKCAGVAATVASRLRRSITGLGGRRRGWSSSVVMHHRRRRQYSTTSFAPVYIDELYSHHRHQPRKPLELHAVAVHEEEPTTSGGKQAAAAGATRSSGNKATARVAAATSTTTSTNTAPAGARAVGGAMKNVLMRSPAGRGGGVLGVVKGMGEVDLRAELFIRRFKEDMRLQSQRSAEEFQAMLARGL